jgi:hypothetical protein
MKILDNLYAQLKSLGKMREFSLKDQPNVSDYKDIYYEVEDLLCFERAIRFCYASLEMMVHNRTIRHQCQNFSKWSLTNEEELEKILTEFSMSDIKIEKRHQAYALPADDFTLESILSLGLVIVEHRLDIYQELRTHLSVKNRIHLNHIISHIWEEIKFFKREKEISSVEGILYSLN